MMYARAPDVITAAWIDGRMYSGCADNVVGVLLCLTARFRLIRWHHLACALHARL